MTIDRKWPLTGEDRMNYTEFLSFINARYTDELAAKRQVGIVPHTELVHACMGLSGETGELVDLIKKSVFYGRPWDQEKLLSELGDVIHYYMRIAHLLNFSLPTIMEYNKNKLKARDATSHNHYFQDAGFGIKGTPSE